MLIIPFRPPWLVSLAGTKLVDCVGRHVCLCAQIDQADMFISKLPPTRRGGVRPPVPGARAAGAGASGPGLGRGPRRAREGRRHAQAPARRVPRGVRRAGRGGNVLRPLLQAVRAVHGRQERREQGRAQGGQEHGGRLVRSDAGTKDCGAGGGLDFALFKCCGCT